MAQCIDGRVGVSGARFFDDPLAGGFDIGKSVDGRFRAGLLCAVFLVQSVGKRVASAKLADLADLCGDRCETGTAP